jgi:hypothetical protein
MASRIAKRILNESLSPPRPSLHPDVVEGFSWTLAETLVETVVREQDEEVERRRTEAEIKAPAIPCSPKHVKIKSILKNKSKSYWSIDTRDGGTAAKDRPSVGGRQNQQANKPLARILAESNLLRASSWHSLFYDKSSQTPAPPVHDTLHVVVDGHGHAGDAVHSRSLCTSRESLVCCDEQRARSPVLLYVSYLLGKFQ